MEWKVEFLLTGKSIVWISWNEPDYSILIISGIVVSPYIPYDPEAALPFVTAEKSSLGLGQYLTTPRSIHYGSNQQHERDCHG